MDGAPFVGNRPDTARIPGAAGDGGSDLERRALEARLDYGMGLFGGGWTGTPSVGLELTEIEPERELVVGWRLAEARRAGLVFGLDIELDLHLHPNWQRNVVRNLTSLFPRLQFVATTHSPFIVQSLDGQGLVNLSESGVLEERKEPYSIEDVAEETMGVDTPQRSKPFLEMEAAAQRYYRLLDELSDNDPEVTEAKVELDRIEARFTDNPVYAALLKLHRHRSAAE